MMGAIKGMGAMASQLLQKTRPRFLLRCWGDFAMTDAEYRDVRPRGRKARALLVYLALHPDKPVSRERLMALLWSHRADEQARGSLRQALFELKPFANGEGLVSVERDSVTLNGAALETDIGRLCELAESTAYDQFLALLPDQDENLFGNLDGLSDGWDEWLQIERSRQHDRLQLLIEDAAAGAAAAGQVRVARSLSERLAQPGLSEPEPAPDFDPMPMVPPIDHGRSGQSDAAVFKTRRSLLKFTIAAPLIGATAAAGFWWSPWRAAAGDPLLREAAGLTDSAKAMLRERDSANVRAAGGLLRRAVSLAPEYAPAWAALSIASAIGEADQHQLAEAESHARKAIRLDPGLADGHAALGLVLGFSGAEAGAHLKRAAALNPGDAQTQFWLGNHYGSELAFDRRLAALRASVASDPLWARGANDAAIMAWQMGYPVEARRYAKRLVQLDPQEAFACEYQLDMANGEFAEITRKMIGNRARFDRPAQGDQKLGATLLILGHSEPARVLLRLQPYQWEIASGATPSPDAFARVDAGAVHDWFDSSYFLALALQKLLHAGRGAEIVAAHERGGGQMAQLSNDDLARFVLVSFGPELGLALKSVGRERDAGRMLSQVERVIREAYAQGAVPIPFDVCAARLWAAQGDRERALALITRAVERGFHYAPVTALPDLGDIFAFRTLRGEPRFEALRTRLRRHLERERTKLGPVLV